MKSPGLALLPALLATALLPGCHGNTGSITVQVLASDRVIVEGTGDIECPQWLMVRLPRQTEPTLPYFLGRMKSGAACTGRFELPRDFALFEVDEKGPTFDKAKFPAGKYVVMLHANPPYDYVREFTVP